MRFIKKITGKYQRLKRKWNRFKWSAERHLKIWAIYAKRYWYYIFLFVFVTFCCVYLFLPYSISSSELDNIRSLLNSNIQFLSTIIALIISASLIVIQLASQTYTPRIMESYVKQPLLWTIVIQFGTAILYDLFLLTHVPFLSSELAKRLADISIFITGSCIISLIPQLLNTARQLKPETVIFSISKSIDKNYVALAQKHWRGRHIGTTLPPTDDPLIAIQEIAFVSIDKSNFPTISATFSMLFTIFKGLAEKENEEFLSFHFAKFFHAVGRRAINSYHEDISSLTVVYVHRLLEDVTERKFDSSRRYFEEVLLSFRDAALTNNLRLTLERVVFYIGQIAEYEYEKLMPKEDDMAFFDSIKGKKLTENEKEKKYESDLILHHFQFDRIYELERIGIAASKAGLPEVVDRSVDSLKEILAKIVESKKGELLTRKMISDIMRAMERIYRESNQQKLEKPLLAISSIPFLIRRNKENKDLVNTVTLHICRICLDSVESALCDSGVINTLGYLGRIIVPDHEEPALFIIETLGKMGTFLKKERENLKDYELKLEQMDVNLKFIKDAIESISARKTHSNKKIKSEADEWIRKLE